MLCLRALVPAGYMLEPIDGRLAVVLCDSDAASSVAGMRGGMPAGMDHGLHEGMQGGVQAGTHHHDGHDHANHHHALDPTCPYAQSAGPSPLPSLPVLDPPSIVGDVSLPAEIAQAISQFGPARQQSPRGPPRLA